VNHVILCAVVLAQLVDLGVAVVATGDAVSGAGLLDLGVFDLAVGETLFLVPGLEEAAAATAAEVVALIGVHVDEVLFANHGLDDETQVVGGFISEGFPDDLTGILDGELDAQLFVPVGVDGELALTDPLCVVVVDVLYFEIVLDVEFFQSCQD